MILGTERRPAMGMGPRQRLSPWPGRLVGTRPKRVTSGSWAARRHLLGAAEETGRSLVDRQAFEISERAAGGRGLHAVERVRPVMSRGPHGERGSVFARFPSCPKSQSASVNSADYRGAQRIATGEWVRRQLSPASRLNAPRRASRTPGTSGGTVDAVVSLAAVAGPVRFRLLHSSIRAKAAECGGAGRGHEQRRIRPPL